ncbi:NADP-dependent oxidoreductase [Umezawaea sp. Da 62-37]|uniref:NADP-dependent oxidoreductase n=1 Tax=Umezawaea sp. Da 62-37 TaxID=3075927 RepID=UPI0028F74A2A|nr:NADP-dependent oxidoreductase [Umezawaea sp. Da 62-37]WNV89864.1 NADP-dependent oxidoreductase [Umezawaea sp. Da 62-37]
MKAITQHAFGGPEVLVVSEVDRPTPLPTEILVRVHAAGVNPVDWKTREGKGMAGVLGEPPFILGWDVSGVVEEVGFGVTTVKPGDEVYGMPWFPRAASAYAEYVTAPSRHFALKPANISHVEAAALPLAVLTAWQALVDTAHVEAGQRVLVHAAAGGVGHFAVQIAKAKGAYVIGTASAGKHEFLRSIGVDEVVDYKTTRFEDVVSDVDVVIDLVGGDNAVRSIKTLRPGGIVVAIPSGLQEGVAEAAEAAGVRSTPFLVEPDHAALTQIAALVTAGELRVAVEAVLPLADAGKAHELGEAGHSTGKIVLSVVD